MKEFKVGDVVILKSGSPPMTVEYIGSGDKEGKIGTVWCKDAEIIRSYFPVQALKERGRDR